MHSFQSLFQIRVLKSVGRVHLTISRPHWWFSSENFVFKAYESIPPLKFLLLFIMPKMACSPKRYLNMGL